MYGGAQRWRSLAGLSESWRPHDCAVCSLCHGPVGSTPLLTVFPWNVSVTTGKATAPAETARLYAKDAVLWGTVSEQLRVNPTEIEVRQTRSRDRGCSWVGQQRFRVESAGFSVYATCLLRMHDTWQ